MQREKRSRACKLYDAYHCIISRTFRRMSFRVDTYIPPISPRAYMNTARSKGQQCINTAAPASCVCFTPAACPYLVLHAVHVMFTCYARAVHVLCVRTGSNLFKSTRSKGQQKTPPLSGTFERNHGIFHKHREVKRPNHFSHEMCSGTLKFLASRRFSHFSYTYFYLILPTLSGYGKNPEKNRKTSNL